MVLLRELINIPEQVNQGDFVLRLTEGVARPAFGARSMESDIASLRSRLRDVAADSSDARLPVSEDAIEGLKFSTCIPKALARGMLRRRLHDERGVRSVLKETVRSVNVVA